MDRSGYTAVTVFCRRDRKVYEMELRIAAVGNGKKIVFPCNGCSNMDASRECCDCIRVITAMFRRSPDMDTGKTLYPDGEAEL